MGADRLTAHGSLPLHGLPLRPGAEGGSGVTEDQSCQEVGGEVLQLTVKFISSLRLMVYTVVLAQLPGISYCIYGAWCLVRPPKTEQV